MNTYFDKNNRKIKFRYEPLNGDREIIESLLVRTGFFSEEEIRTAIELLDEKLAACGKSSYKFVFASVDVTVIGYACYGLIPLTESGYDLYWIAVDPEFQGSGVGKALLTRVESDVQESGGLRVYIDTASREQYKPTREFYKSRGYSKAAHFPDFYSKGDDKVVFVKKLSSV